MGPSALTDVGGDAGRQVRPAGLVAQRRARRQGDRHGRGHESTVVHFADAYGRDRTIELRRTEEITIHTKHSGGWYDIALTAPSDAGFSYQLAGRLESAGRLTSDPQLGRS